MESCFVLLLACISAMVIPSLQYDDGVLSLKEASLARMARRERGKLNLNGEFVGRSGGRLRVSIQDDRTSGGSGLRINGEYFGPNGGSIQGSIRRDRRRGLDLFRGAHGRGDLDASFDARLPSGAGIGGRAKLRRRLNAGLTGISGGVAGQFEGGVRDGFGNHFGGGFQGGFNGRLRGPVVATSYVAGPHVHRGVVIG